MPTALNLVGQRFSKLHVLKRDKKNKWGAWMWICRCDCGEILSILGNSLISGNTTKCSKCAHADLAVLNTKHGNARRKASTPEYNALRALIQRCLNPNHPEYKNYGARGIKVAERYLYGEDDKTSIECFLEDVGKRPTPKHSIDRIDNNSGYFPGNIRWAVDYTQQRNKRSNIYIFYQQQKLPLTDALVTAQVSYDRFRAWYKKGYPPQEAFDKAINGEFIRKVPLYTYNSKTMNLSSWAKEVNIDVSLLLYRIKKAGWSFEDAITIRPSASRASTDRLMELSPKDRKLRAQKAALARWNS